MDDDRSSVLLIRVWLEDGADSFRARLTTVAAPRGRGPGNEVAVAVAARPAAVSDAVQASLLSFVGSAAGVGRGG